MMSVAAHVMCYAAALDSGNVDDAARHLESFLKHKDVYPRGFREALVLEAAYFEARHRNRPIVAREYLEASRSAISERHSRFRAEAAVLAAEGKVEESREKAREGLACAGKSWDPGGARAEIDQLKELLDAQA